jgi:hypothetical protein
MPTTATDITTIQSGDKFRITRTEGSHGFPVGTVVTVCEWRGETEWYVPEGEDGVSFMATTLDDIVDPTHRIGTSAWVVFGGRADGMSEGNVEPFYDTEPEPHTPRSFQDRLAAFTAAVPDTNPWSGNQHRLVPDTLTPVRITDVTGTGGRRDDLVGREGYLLQTDPHDAGLTFLVAVDGRTDQDVAFREEDWGVHLPGEESDWTVRWVRDVEFLPTLPEHFTVRLTERVPGLRPMTDYPVDVTAWPTVRMGQWPLVTWTGDGGWTLADRPNANERLGSWPDTRGYWVSADVIDRLRALLPEPEVEAERPEVALCEVNYHPGEPHEHWATDRYPDRMLFANVGFVGPANYTQHGGLFGKGSHVSHGVTPEPVTVEDVPSVTVTDLPPEEVVRLIREGESADDVQLGDAAAIEALVEQVTAARRERDEARQERAQWIDNAVTVSRRHARGADWCGVYDRTMEALGLPGRGDDDDDDDEPEMEWVTVTQDVVITASHSVPDADDYFVEEFGAPHAFVEYESDTDEVDMSVTIRLSTEVEVAEGNCACGEGYVDWAEHLPTWVTNNHLSWTTTGDEECGND